MASFQFSFSKYQRVPATILKANPQMWEGPVQRNACLPASVATGGNVATASLPGFEHGCVQRVWKRPLKITRLPLMFPFEETRHGPFSNRKHQERPPSPQRILKTFPWVSLRFPAASGWRGHSLRVLPVFWGRLKAKPKGKLHHVGSQKKTPPNG